MITVNCLNCNIELHRYPKRASSTTRHFCSGGCRALYDSKRLEYSNEFRCGRCKRILSRNSFKWGKKRRRSYCIECTTASRKEYHSSNYKINRANHDAWRKKCLYEGGDTALKWYFTRHINQYKRRSRINNYKCTITPNQLVELYHKQNGLCYYTGQQLRWNTYGVGSGNTPNDALSVDRRDNNRGYEIDNVVLCTYEVNSIKRHLSEQQLYDMCSKILDINSKR